MIFSWSGEDDQPHWDWNKAQTSMEGSSEEYWTMGESLIQQYYMSDDGFST